jgi:eukaryotic-like serine/threonine-protein kinase
VVGRTLSHYRVEERLGAGGMGEVYRARDLKLDRDVALKVLPQGALADEAARSRFRKEAHALSRLSHPHVATLLDFDSEDGTDFLVMELVTGPSLDETLRQGPLSEKDVLRLGAQLARGLQAAHDQGVVHRDLKPSNLALTPDGLLKILDFGLARLLHPPRANPGHTTATETADGGVVGSPPYMAPEQLLGKPSDVRSDLYSAGAVLYELATGSRPFGSRSGVALTDAILHEPPPPPRGAHPALSAGLEAVILKALDKDPDLRCQTAKDLLVDLERLQLRGSTGVPAGASVTAGTSGSSALTGAVAAGLPGRRRPRRWVAAVAAGLLAVGVFAWWRIGRRPPPRITSTFPLVWIRGEEDAVTTDGTRVYSVASRDGHNVLQQVPIAGSEPLETPLPFRGTVLLFGAVPGESALLAAASADETGAIRFSGEGWPLWELPVPAGTPRRIAGLVARWADASPDGRQLAVIRGRSILVASIDGSSPRELHQFATPPDRVRWSPDGTRLRFSAPGPAGVAESWIWEMRADGSSLHRLWRGHWGNWTGDGRYYVFDRPPTHDLLAVEESWWTPWAPSWARIPRPLTSGIARFGLLGSSSNGDRLIVQSSPANPTSHGTLLRYDPRRKVFEPALGGESAFYAEPSPDGRWLAWVRYPEGTMWRSRPDGSDRVQLTSAPAVAHLPRWSPDGTRLVFVSQPDPSGSGEVHVVAADGSGGESVLARPESPSLGYWDACWLPDGSVVLGRLSASGLFRFDPQTGRVAPVGGAGDLRYPKCSRQGDVLAYGPPAGNRLRRWGTTEWLELRGVPPLYPNWTRDGRSVCGLLPDRRIGCLRVEDGRATVLAGASTLGLAGWVNNVPWMGLDAEDRPLVAAAPGAATSILILYLEKP